MTNTNPRAVIAKVTGDIEIMRLDYKIRMGETDTQKLYYWFLKVERLEAAPEGSVRSSLLSHAKRKLAFYSAAVLADYEAVPVAEDATPTIEQVQAAHDEAISAGYPFVARPLAHIILSKGQMSSDRVLKFWNISRERLEQGRYTHDDDARWLVAQIAIGNVTAEAAAWVWANWDTSQRRDFYRAYEDTEEGNACDADVDGDSLGHARELGLIEVGSRRVTKRGMAFTKAINQ